MPKETNKSWPISLQSKEYPQTSAKAEVGRDALEERRGGGVWNLTICIPQTAQIDISFCICISFCPTMKSGSRLGGRWTPPLPLYGCQPF